MAPTSTFHQKKIPGDSQNFPHNTEFLKWLFVEIRHRVHIWSSKLP